MEITEQYRKLVKKDLVELDKLVSTLEIKIKSLRIMTDEMIEVISSEKIDKVKSGCKDGK